MPNLETIISGHNKKVLDQGIGNTQQTSKCNCRGGASQCPLQGECLEKSVVYRANIQANNKSVNYIGQTSNTFKERFRNHTLSFNSKKYETNT